MGTTVGSLSIDIGVNPAGVASGMAAAKGSVKSGVDSMHGALDSLKGFMASIGAGLTVAAFAGWVKGAIEAADSTSKMAQKLGLATDEVAGLQLAFRQAGVGEEFEQAMGKLAKSAASGSEAFKAMGINVKESDGTLKSTRALLGEVADAMAGYEDGTAKIALAQELFGKSGAQLIPLLNAGAEGLAEYDAMAHKLGLTINDETAKSAEKFNDTLDLIGQGSQGVARQVAAQLLPTLSGLADQFFTSMSNGDKLRNVADFLASSMKVLYIAGVAVVEAFSTVGKTLGGVFGAIGAAVSGDFTGAMGILKEMKADIGTGWKDTLKQIEGAWNATGSASIESMAATQRALKNTAPLVKDLEDKTKASAKAHSDLEKAAKAAYDAVLKATQARASDRKKEEDAIEAYLLAEDQRRNATVKASNEAVAAAQAEYDNYGKTRSQIAELTLARLEDKLQAYHAGSENARVVELEIENQRKLIAILQKGEARDASVEASKQAAAQMNSVWASVDKTAHDTFVNIFSGGQDAFTKLRDTLKATLLDLLYQMTLKKWIFDLSASFSGSSVGQLLNLGNAASGSSTLSSIGSTVGQALGIGGSAVAGSAAVATPVLGGTAGVVVTELAPLGASAGASTGAAAGSSLLGSLSSAVPYVAGMLAVAAALGAFSPAKELSPAEVAEIDEQRKRMEQERILRETTGLFASGGDHMGGLRVVGEEGPELELTGPSRIFSASQTKDILSGANSTDVVDAIESLKATIVNAVAAAVSAGNSNFQGVARKLDAIETNGRLANAAG